MKDYSVDLSITINFHTFNEAGSQAEAVALAKAEVEERYGDTVQIEVVNVEEQ